jgi:hypothetical protein
MSTTTPTKTTATPFAEGLIDEILAQLPFGVRFDLIINWATQFAIDGFIPDPAIREIIGTISTLDFKQYLSVNEKTFTNLIHLPFSHHLVHLDLSQTPIGKSQACVSILGNPIFQNLITLNLKDTRLNNIDPLLDAPQQFLNLHTLNLSDNDNLRFPKLATTTQFPNLKLWTLLSCIVKHMKHFFLIQQQGATQFLKPY